jgi:imidazolonepropionase-like amidohydrolase
MLRIPFLGTALVLSLTLFGCDDAVSAGIGGSVDATSGSVDGAAGTESIAPLEPLTPPTSLPSDTGGNAVLITNVRIFNGKSAKLVDGMSVLVEGNKITRIDKDITVPEDAVNIDAQGRVLMPGLIDAHWHSLFATRPQAEILASDIGYLTLVAAQANEDALMRGFTTVRDMGGNVFSLKKATDEGLIDGPRIFPSGPYLSQTGGHGDFRGPNDVPTNPGAPLDYLQRVGLTIIANGVPEVMWRSREIFRMGASQVKIMAGGGVSSLHDPLDVTQYTLEEMKAAVDVAKTYNTYVAAHANTDAAVRQAIEAGVQSIEHGMLMEESTLELMAKRDVWLSIQPLLNDEDALAFPDPVSHAKWIEATNGTEKVYRLAKAHGVKVAFGTDTLFDPELAKKQGKLLTKLTRWYSPHEVLKMATHDNAQLLALSGPRNPYPGKLGVIEEGAYADLLLVDGNPLDDIELIADPEKNFVLIMKDGKIYKNTTGDQAALSDEG